VWTEPHDISETEQAGGDDARMLNWEKIGHYWSTRGNCQVGHIAYKRGDKLKGKAASQLGGCNVVPNAGRR